MKIIRPSVFSAAPGVLAALSTRLGGVSPAPLGMNLSFNVGDVASNVVQNRTVFFGGLGIGLEELAVPQQVHSATVRRADMAGKYAECDALISSVARVFLCVSFADCVPILICEPESGVVAAVHAGWRGTASEIAALAVAAIGREYGVSPDRLLAYIGPAADSCCYRVGEEVADRFSPRFVRLEGKDTYVDLKKANYQQLLDSGVQAGQVELSPLCTITEVGLFHSFRRDKERSGRMMAVIGMTGSKS